MGNNYIITRDKSEICVINLINDLIALTYQRGNESIVLINVVDTIMTYIDAHINNGSYEDLIELIRNSEFDDISDSIMIYPKSIVDEEYQIDSDSLELFIDNLIIGIDNCNDSNSLFTNTIADNLMQIKQSIESDLTETQKYNTNLDIQYQKKLNQLNNKLDENEYLDQKYRARVDALKKTFDNNKSIISKEQSKITEVFGYRTSTSNGGFDYYINVGNEKEILIKALNVIIQKINTIVDSGIYDENEYINNYLVSYLLYYAANECPDVIEEGTTKQEKYPELIDELLNTIKAAQDESELENDFDKFIYKLYKEHSVIGDWDNIETTAITDINTIINDSIDVYPYSEENISSLLFYTNKSYTSTKSTITNNLLNNEELVAYREKFEELKEEYENLIGSWEDWPGEQPKEGDPIVNPIKDKDITKDNTEEIIISDIKVNNIIAKIDGKVISSINVDSSSDNITLTLDLSPVHHNHFIEGDVSVNTSVADVITATINQEASEIIISNFNIGQTMLTINVQDATLEIPVTVTEYQYLYFYEGNNPDIFIKDENDKIIGFNYSLATKYETEEELFNLVEDRPYRYRLVENIGINPNTEHTLDYLLLPAEYLDKCFVISKSTNIQVMSAGLIGYTDHKCILIDYRCLWETYGIAADVEIRLGQGRLLPSGVDPIDITQ